MEFTTTHHYDHPAATVLAALTDFEAIKQKYEAQGHADVVLVERSEDGGAVTVTTQRVVPLELPGFAKRVLSPKQSVTQTDTWSAPDDDGVRHGTFSAQAKGAPVRVHGTLRLEPTGDEACINELQITVECSVPLVGGRIADFVAGDTRTAVAHDEEWTQQYLAGG